MDLTTATPSEIDTALAEVYDRLSDALAKRERAYDSLRYAVKESLGLRYSAPDPDRETVVSHAAECVEVGGSEWSKTGRVAKAAQAYESAVETYYSVLTEVEPFDEEFDRRGGWTRAFLVLNNNGHVHRSRNCATTYVTTRWGWLPQESGKDEAEIVEGAGADACTVCYPSAPVDSLRRPRRTLHTSEVEAQKARDERARAKAEREAKKVAKAISNPDGSPLEVFDWHVAERHYQQRDGSIKVTPAHDRFETLSTAAAAKTWLTESQEHWTHKRPEDVQRVAEALAAKNGTTAEEEVAAAKKRAAKRR